MSKKFTHRFDQFKFPKLERTEIDGVRMYVSPSGIPYPSVTTVLAEYSREGIDAWKKRVGLTEANRVSRHASERGTGVHGAVEKFLLNEEVPTKGMNPLVKSLYVQMKPELLMLDNICCLETPLYSDVLKLAGTVDCIAEFNGELTVIDFKTSKHIKSKEQIENYFMQCCAYAIMFEEHTGIRINRGLIIIGTDNHKHPQMFFFDPHDYRKGLEGYISIHNRKALFG